MAIITIKKLLESGVHFGHFIKKRHPEMKRANYIFTKRNGIDIIDLQKTFDATKKAYEVVRDRVRKGQKVLFIGTKKQAQDIIAQQAQHAGMYYINRRWCGGLFTNFSVIKHSIQELVKMEKMEEDGQIDTLTKKELSSFRKKKDKLDKMWSGVKDMRTLPDVIFFIDAKKEEAAINEAKKIGIFVIALVDTNSDPTPVDHVIPANDDAIRSISLFASIISDAVLDGIQGEDYQMFDDQSEEQADVVAYARETLQERERVESNEEWAAQSERYQKDQEIS